MAHTAHDRPTTGADERERARVRLEDAFAERDRCRRRYEERMGTTCELGAYLRLRQASEHVSACDKWLRWVESDNYLRVPRADHTPVDALITL
jgi:hypothetical protein